MSANIITLKNPDGDNEIIDEAEDARIDGDFEDLTHVPITGASITGLTLTLQDELTGAVINNRFENDILNTNGGTVDADGHLILILGPDDNEVLDSTLAVEFHIASVKWTWVETGTGLDREGTARWRVQVAPGVGVTVEPANDGPVNPDGSIRSPLIIGDDYLIASNNAFEWFIAKLEGEVIAPTAVFEGWEQCGCSDPPTWSVAGTVDSLATHWHLRFEMPSSVTTDIPSGLYDWAVRVTRSGGTSTMFGSALTRSVQWTC